MDFHLNIIQTPLIDAHARIYLYENLARHSRSWGLAGRTITPLIAIGFGLMSYVREIAQLAEMVFKGVANISACPFTKKASFFTGVGMLYCAAGRTVFVLPFKLTGITLLVLGRIIVWPFTYPFASMAFEARKDLAVEQQKVANEVYINSSFASS